MLVPEELLLATGTARVDEDGVDEEGSGAEDKYSGAGEGEVAMVDVPEAVPEPLELLLSRLSHELEEPDVSVDSWEI